MEIGEFVQSIKRKLHGHSPQKVSDLVAPPKGVFVKESRFAKPPQQSAVTGVKPEMKEINKLLELKVNPAEFNKRNKN